MPGGRSTSSRPLERVTSRRSGPMTKTSNIGSPASATSRMAVASSEADTVLSGDIEGALAFAPRHDACLVVGRRQGDGQHVARRFVAVHGGERAILDFQHLAGLEAVG